MSDIQMGGFLRGAHVRPRLRTLRAEFIRKHLPVLTPLTGWVCEGDCVRAEGETARIAYLRWERQRDNLGFLAVSLDRAIHG